MAKYYGAIGFGVMEETAPDVFREIVTEKYYSGDVLKDTRKWQGSEYLNDDLNIGNRISIIADPYAFHNFHSIKYITWMGTKWKVKSIDVAYPRLILDVGGVYHEQQT